MIERVLDFSRIDQGRKQYEFEPIDPSHLVIQTLQIMESYAAEKGVRLESRLDGARRKSVPGEIHWDGRAIQQALINLIDNAIKHSPTGGQVTIGMESNHSRQPPRPTVCLWVQDQGEGIPPEEHERIFEWFYRSGSELCRKTQGVGIGLSLVKPFSTDELLARVRALLRRARRRARIVNQVELGDTRIDFVKQRVVRQGKELHLTAKEFAVLRLLAEAKGEPVSRDRFLDVVWGYAAFPTTRTVDTHIASLRSKIENDLNEPQWIQTVHGVGYRLENAKS